MRKFRVVRKDGVDEVLCDQVFPRPDGSVQMTSYRDSGEEVIVAMYRPGEWLRINEV